MSIMTAEAVPLAALTDDELAAMFRGADDDQAAAVLAEAQRRDDTSKRRQARRQEPAACAWEEAARAQYAQAERDCAGNLIARDAPPWLTDEFSLWRYGNDRYATEELRNWFLDHPRLTLTRYQQQVRDNQEVYRNDLDEDAAGAVRLDAAGDEAGPRGSGDRGADVVPVAAARVEAGNSSRSDGPVRDGQHVRPGGAVTTSTFADITALTAEFAWPRFIPLGELTILAAAGGSGKSFTCCDLAARMSTGRPMPDGSPGIDGSIIMINLEDDAATSTVHRLAAHGADMSRIYDMSEVDGRPFSIPGDLPRLRQAIAEIGDVVMVTIDPLSAAASVSLTAALAARDVVCRPLQQVARDTGCAVVAAAHLTKAGTVAGSRAIIDAPRSVLLIESDKDDATIKIMSVFKSNVSRTGTMIRYQITGTWPEMTVSWLPAADDRQTVALSAADSIILALDSADGPMSSRQLAAQTGHSYGAVRSACTRLMQAGKISAADGAFYTSRCNSAGQMVAAV
jgi:hypothetical protein